MNLLHVLIFLQALFGAPFGEALPSIKPSIRTADIVSLRGGDAAVASDVVSAAWCDPDATAKAIASLTTVCSVLMVAAPEFAMTKIFKTSAGSTMTPNEQQLLENMGLANLSTGVTSLLLIFRSSYPLQAVALGMIPRYIVLLKTFLLPRPSCMDLNLDALVPVYAFLSICIAALFTDKIPLSAQMASKLVGGVFLLAGMAVCLAPDANGKSLNIDFDKDKLGKPLLRSQGKTDMINGGLLLGLGLEYSTNKAIGLSCVVWAAAVVLCEGVFQNYVAMGSPLASVVIQLVIAGVSSKMLFLE